jgi:hypothetical protein
LLLCKKVAQRPFFIDIYLFVEAVMASKADEILKHIEDLHDTDNKVEKEHTLQENAKERALHPDHINAGTAFDWEDMEAYAKELERLDREGPGAKKP